MTDLLPARTLRRAGTWRDAFGHVVLRYETRFLRRKRLITAQGAGFLVSLDETVSVAHGDAFELDDDRSDRGGGTCAGGNRRSGAVFAARRPAVVHIRPSAKMRRSIWRQICGLRSRILT